MAPTYAITSHGNLQLLESLTVDVWVCDGVVNRVIVPADYVSDGATIPTLLWPILGPPIRSNHLVPSIVHDYLCDTATDYDERVLADAVFFKLLRDHGVKRWKQAAMYFGVRFWGRWMWRWKHFAA